MDELQLSLIKHTDQIFGLVLVCILALGVIRYRNLFVAWIVIFAIVRATYLDNYVVDFVLGNVIAVMLTILIYRYMRIAVVYARMRRGADLEAIKHATNTAIIATDNDGNVVSWDRAAERLFGVTSDEAIGKHLEDVFYDGSKRSVRRLLKCAVENKQCTEHMELARSSTRDRIGVAVHSQPALKDDRIIGALLTVRADKRGQDYAQTHPKVDR